MNPFPSKTVHSATPPWVLDEYVLYRGFRLVYTQSYDGKLYIHFPGRMTYESNALTDREALRFPKRLRTHPDGRGK